MATDQGKELTEEVVVQSSDALVIRDALNLAYYQNISLDMVEAYRDINEEGETSRLTATLGEALTKAKAIVNLAKGDDTNIELAEEDGEPDSED